MAETLDEFHQILKQAEETLGTFNTSQHRHQQFFRSGLVLTFRGTTRYGLIFADHKVVERAAPLTTTFTLNISMPTQENNIKKYVPIECLSMFAVINGNFTVPVWHCVIAGRSCMELFKVVLNKVTRMFPSIQPRFIITDDNRSLATALKSVWPEAKYGLCWSDFQERAKKFYMMAGMGDIISNSRPEVTKLVFVLSKLLCTPLLRAGDVREENIRLERESRDILLERFEQLQVHKLFERILSVFFCRIGPNDISTAEFITNCNDCCGAVNNVMSPHYIAGMPMATIVEDYIDLLINNVISLAIRHLNTKDVWVLEGTSVAQLHRMRQIQAEYASNRISPQQLLVQMSEFISMDIPRFLADVDSSDETEVENPMELPAPIEHNYGEGYDLRRRNSGGALAFADQPVYISCGVCLITDPDMFRTESCPHALCAKCLVNVRVCPYCRKSFGRFYPIKLGLCISHRMPDDAQTNRPIYDRAFVQNGFTQEDFVNHVAINRLERNRREAAAELANEREVNDAQLEDRD